MSVSGETRTRPYSLLRVEVALDPLMREAMDAVMALGASPIQASWTMIGWTLDDLLARGADPALLAADLRHVAGDLTQHAGQRRAA